MKGKLIGVYNCLDDVHNEVLDMIYSEFMDAVSVDIQPLSKGDVYYATKYHFDPSKINLDAVHLVISDTQNDVYQLRGLN